MNADPQPHFAIACGGTGGHLFPGVAVGEAVLARGGSVTLLVSTKEIDRQAVRGVRGMEVVTLPAVGWQGRNAVRFIRAFWASRRDSIAVFRARMPTVVLGMGGFTSAGPILAGRKLGAVTCLHESNTVPGRANRWLSHVVSACFVGFPEAVARLNHPDTTVTGTPVRARFRPLDGPECRAGFGLDPARPVLAVMGGSQGASGLNTAVVSALSHLQTRFPQLQFIHLCGERDAGLVDAAYRQAGLRAWVRPFCMEMERVLGAATVVMARSGASTLAEIAAVGAPAILVPFPAATDQHQFHNAAAFAGSGAAILLEQRHANPENIGAALAPFLGSGGAREAGIRAASAWHRPDAAHDIAARLWDFAHVSPRRSRALQKPDGRPSPAPSL